MALRDVAERHTKKHKRHWMAGAVKHPGALRSTLKRMGLFSGKGDIPASALAKARARAEKSGNTKLLRRIALAKTFKKYGKH